jgi:hypothetical protein
MWGTWFVDNSDIELGKPLPPEDIARAVITLKNAGGKANREVVAILPDELLDGPKTVAAAADAIIKFRRRDIDNLMYVPQGKTWDEIIRSAEAFQGVKEIKWIGVAKNFVSVLGSRQQITVALQSIFPNCRFHMLGWSRNILDDVTSTLLPGVEGIDSSMPLRLSTPISWTSTFPKRNDWWKEGMECTDLMANNVKQVMKWLGQNV